MGIKTVKYGMKYGPWRFRHYVIGITLQTQYNSQFEGRKFKFCSV